MPLGMPGVGGGEMPPIRTPGMAPGGNPMADQAVAALSQVMPQQTPNPTAALARVEEAFDLAHKLVMAALPQIAQWNPKVARDAHAAGRTLLSIKSALRQDIAPQPPPDLMLGMGLGGAPGPLGPPAVSGGGGFAGP